MLQDAWLCYQIDLTAEKLLHLAAFAHDPAVQDTFTEDRVPESTRKHYLDQFSIEDEMGSASDRARWLERSRRRSAQ